MLTVWFWVGVAIVVVAFPIAAAAGRRRRARCERINPAARSWHQQLFVSERVRYVEKERAAMGQRWTPVGKELARSPYFHGDAPDHGYKK